MGTAYWILSTALLVAMATLIITLNHLSHKEYSEELDRLRRDLLAGQRVAQRYEDTILEQTLRHNEELLRQTTVSLRQCSSRLQLMTANWQRTRTPQDSKASPSDSIRWREKLARKRSVEADVLSSREFRGAFSQKMSDMEQSLEGFTQEELKFCQAFKKSLADSLHRRSVELSTVSEQVAALVDSHTQMIQDVEKHSTEQASMSQQWVQELLSFARSTSDSEANTVHNFLTESFLPAMQSLQHHILLLKSELQGLSGQLSQQLRQHVDTVQTFSTSQSESLSQLRDSVLHQVVEQQRQLERARELGRGLQRAERTLDKDLSSQLLQAVKLVRSAHALWQSHRLEWNLTLQEMDTSVGAAQELSDRLLDDATSTLNLQVKRAADMRSGLETVADDVLDGAAAFIERSSSHAAQLSRYHDDVQQEVRTALGSCEGAWREHYQRTEQELRRLAESLRAAQQTGQEHRQMVLGALRESAEAQEATLEQHRLDYSQVVRLRQNELEDKCSYSGEWSRLLLSELRHLDQLLDMDVDQR